VKKGELWERGLLGGKDRQTNRWVTVEEKVREKKPPKRPWFEGRKKGGGVGGKKKEGNNSGDPPNTLHHQNSGGRPRSKGRTGAGGGEKRGNG